MQILGVRVLNKAHFNWRRRVLVRTIEKLSMMKNVVRLRCYKGVCKGLGVFNDFKKGEPRLLKSVTNTRSIFYVYLRTFDLSNRFLWFFFIRKLVLPIWFHIKVIDVRPWLFKIYDGTAWNKIGEVSRLRYCLIFIGNNTLRAVCRECG